MYREVRERSEREGQLPHSFSGTISGCHWCNHAVSHSVHIMKIPIDTSTNITLRDGEVDGEANRGAAWGCVSKCGARRC